MKTNEPVVLTNRPQTKIDGDISFLKIKESKWFCWPFTPSGTTKII